MDRDALLELLTDSSRASQDACVQTPKKVPISQSIVESQEDNISHASPDSPLHNYSTTTHSSFHQANHTQQQRLLSTLDDDSLLKLVNAYEKPTEKRSLLGRESDDNDSEYDDSQDEISQHDESLHDENPFIVTSPAASQPQSDPSVSDSDSVPLAASPHVAHDPVTTRNFGDYGQYFSDKKIQQQDRDDYIKKLYQDALNNGETFPPIFKDCTVYINGRTDPDRMLLHQKLVLYGGQFLHFLSGKTSATHIIASNLTSKKRIDFQNYKVVTPSWVIDSVAAGKRLPWQDYALLTGDYGQQKLNLANAKSNELDTSSTSFRKQRDNDAASTTLDCKNPNFLQSFFAKSRLHHLSTWKADLRALFCHKYIDQAQVKPIREGENVAIFHVDFDCFFATVSALSDTRYDLQKDALAVAHGTSSSDIASCNYVARSFGVRNGMWVRSARRLCPDLICLPYNFEQYEINSKLLYQILAGTNFFQMILPISIDEAICVKRLDKSSNFHEIQQLCEDVAQSIRQQVFTATNGCTVSIGCGPSLVCARLALKKAKPNGHCVVIDLQNQAQIDHFLSEFSLRDLPGIGTSIIDKVCQQILSDTLETPTIGELKSRSSLQLLISKLGTKTGRKVHFFLSGKDDEENSRILRNPFDYFARKSISVDINYAIRFDTIHEIDDFIDRICEHLIPKIIELGMLTPQVTLKIMRRCEHAPIEPAKYMGSGECDTFSRSSRFGVPTDEIGLIATEIKSSFRMLSCPPKELRGLAVQLNKLETKAGRGEQRKLPFMEQQHDSFTGTKISALKVNAFHALPQALKEDVRSEFVKRKIEVPPSPSGKRTSSTSPVKEYWEKFNKQNDTFKQEMPSSLDEEFMNHLPSQIQREIKRDYAIVKKTRSSVRRRIVSTDIPVLKPWLKHRSTISEVDKFQALERPREICNLVGTWIDQTVSVGPHIDDLNLFDRYLERLATKGRTHQILQIAKLMSSRLEYHSSFTAAEIQGRQEWEEYLLRRIIPILNSSTSERNANIQVIFDL
ncbi:LANO_0C01486g1_1 [Lachancea nothofagi CBS 11611]|uniref:DNA repair protein REV1 n=1 Tax=Lachancea nothofagi CBS 11611 TaxID=1266666 RepID=A0A1G4J464_9SACH|nr:LANO_0C01486g1_1 [Lachancea nothofagi CBS 11611]